MGLKPSSTRREITSSNSHPPLLIEPSAKPLCFEEPPHTFNTQEIERDRLLDLIKIDKTIYNQNKHDFIQNYLERFGDGYFVYCEDCLQE
jgi:hypothetical protein